MDFTQAPGFKRRPQASSSVYEVTEINRSLRPFSASLSSSSPSSEPSSPLSTSSSVCANASVQRNHFKGQGPRIGLTKASSTSLCRSVPSLSSFSKTTLNTNTSKTFSPVLSDVGAQQADKEKNMYDPFYPTEGDREGKMEALYENEEEKYDPFDPTGSPASDVGESSGSVKLLKRKAERQGDEVKEKPPPDSTGTMSVLPAVLKSQAPKLCLRRRVDCSTTITTGRRESIDSDDSEIEEGEIVGAAERDAGIKKTIEEIHPLNSPGTSFFGPKTERILRVLDGDNFVSVRAEGKWEVDQDTEDEPEVGVEDLRRKLVNRRKERYLSFPASTTLSPEPAQPHSQPPSYLNSSPASTSAEQSTLGHAFARISKDCDQRKSKDKSSGRREERRKKRRKQREAGHNGSREKEHGHKTGKGAKGRRSSRSSSQKRKKKKHSSPEASRSHSSSGKDVHIRYLPEECDKERERDKDKKRNRDRDGYRNRDQDRSENRDREREKDRSKEKDHDKGHSSTHKKNVSEREASSRKKDSHVAVGQRSGSRERGSTNRSNRSRENRMDSRDREHDRERKHRRDGRPVVPPSIQDLNGSDLFAIKRTITVTTTTTTTTVPGSPRLLPASPERSKRDSDKSHKRKRKWHLVAGEEDRGSSCSQSQSLSPPPRYHSYESDHFSDKLEIDMLSLDGEALDSDYPSLEDTPPPALPPEAPTHSPKTKSVPKIEQCHPKKKSRSLKKVVQSESPSASSIRKKSKCFSSLTGASGSTAVLSTKRNKKLVKDKDSEKGSKKEAGHSGKSKKDNGGSRKSKLQSKVSVLVREGVSSTTGASVGSGKLGMELLGAGGTTGGSASSVVGGSIAVVFCRDNESRSPFLKPCSESLPLSSMGKELSGKSKCSSLAAPLSSLTSPAGMKSKKGKPSSTTSTSSSASSPTLSQVSKRRSRQGKKVQEKQRSAALAEKEESQAKASSGGWIGASSEVQAVAGEGKKSLSPQAASAPCPSSSSSVSTSALQPCSSPSQTPPSVGPSRDTRESSPDSQTVDSSCKTPENSFLAEDCPTQTSPAPPSSSPVNLSAAQGPGLTAALSLSASTNQPLSSDDEPGQASPPCLSSSVNCALTSISAPPSSSDPSSSSVSSSSTSKAPPLPPAAAPGLPWNLQTGVDCTTGGVLALTALLFKMEEANIASRAKAQEFIQATSQILSQSTQSQSQQHAPPSSASSSAGQIPPPPCLPPLPPPVLSPAQFILHGSLPLVGCTKTPPAHLHPSMAGACAQSVPSITPVGLTGIASGITGGSAETSWDAESKDPDKYLKKLHTQERAVEEVKLAIKPYYQRKDINKDEYKDILRKAVHKICHSRTGEINPVKVSNLVKLYVQRYKYFRKHGRKMSEEERDDRESGALHSSA